MAASSILTTIDGLTDLVGKSMVVATPLRGANVLLAAEDYMGQGCGRRLAAGILSRRAVEVAVADSWRRLGRGGPGPGLRRWPSTTLAGAAR